MKKLFKIFITFILTLSLLSIIAPSSEAQMAGVLVYPNVVELDFSKSDRKFVSRLIKVENTSKEPIRIRAYVEGWNMNEDGGIIFLETPDEHSLNTFMKFNPREFDLAPAQNQIVRLTAKLPEGIDGEFRSIIFFETVSSKEQLIQPDNKKVSVVVNFKTRYGVAVYAYKGLTSKNATINKLDYTVKDNKGFLTVNLSNEGNIHCNVEGELTLVSNSNKKETSIKTARYTILPKSTQNMSIQIPDKDLESGNYTGRIRLTYKNNEEKEEVLEAETSFDYIPALMTSSKNKLAKPITDEEIKMTPENVAKPTLIDETEIKLKPEAN